MLGDAVTFVVEDERLYSRYANGKFNLALTSLPPRKARPRSGANLFRGETAGHEDKDHLWMKLGTEAKKDLFCPVMAFEWRCLSVNDLYSRFSCRLTTATAVMERAWSPVTRTKKIRTTSYLQIYVSNFCPTGSQSLVKKALSEKISARHLYMHIHISVEMYYE